MEFEGVATTIPERAPAEPEMPLLHSNPFEKNEIKGKKPKKGSKKDERPEEVWSAFIDTSRNLLSSWFDDFINKGHSQESDSGGEEVSLWERFQAGFQLWGKKSEQQKPADDGFSLYYDDVFPRGGMEWPYETVDFFKSDTITHEEKSEPLVAVTATTVLVAPLAHTAQRLHELFQPAVTETPLTDAESPEPIPLENVPPEPSERRSEHFYTRSRVSSRDSESAPVQPLVERVKREPEAVFTKTRSLGVLGYGLHELTTRFHPSARIEEKRAEPPVILDMNKEPEAEQKTVATLDVVAPPVAESMSEHTSVFQGDQAVIEIQKIDAARPVLMEAVWFDRSAPAAEAPPSDRLAMEPVARPSSEILRAQPEKAAVISTEQESLIAPLKLKKVVEALPRLPARKEPEERPKTAVNTERKGTFMNRPKIEHKTDAMTDKTDVKFRFVAKNIRRHQPDKTPFLRPERAPSTAPEHVVETTKKPQKKLEIPEHKKSTKDVTTSLSQATIMAPSEALQEPPIVYHDYLKWLNARLKEPRASIVNHHLQSQKRATRGHRYAKMQFYAKRAAQFAGGSGIAIWAVRLVF